MHIHPPKDCVDFIVGEVKGGKGKKNPNFNAKFYQRSEAVEKVLNRIGAFTKEEITDLIPKVSAAAKPENWRKHSDFPVLPIESSRPTSVGPICTGSHARLEAEAADHLWR